jgi:hypothetical protein
MPTITIKSGKMTNPDNIKHIVDYAAISAGGLAFFQSIPWPEIAGFLSSIWILTRLYEYIRGKFRDKK